MYQPPKYVTVAIHPPEADKLAEELRAAQREVDGLFAAYREVLARLEVSWEGQAKERYMDSAGRPCFSLQGLSAFLGAQASLFGGIYVTVRRINPFWKASHPGE